MKTWVEVENTYLTNQPTLLRPVGRGRGRRYERIPDPDRPPTEAYLWAWKCTRTTRGVSRRRYLHTLRASSEKELDAQLVELFERNDVILIAEQGPEYASYRGDPQRLCEPPVDAAIVSESRSLAGCQRCAHDVAAARWRR